MENILQHTNKTLAHGHNKPLGATLTPSGVNFAISSKYAAEVFLQLFDPHDETLTDTIKIKNKHDNIWHVFVKDLKAGQLYGYKINGDFAPAQGKRFNPNKLLLDPYAKSITGKFNNADNLIFGYEMFSKDKDLSMDKRDNTHAAPKAMVIDDAFDWEGDHQLNIPMAELIIYECHLKGFTAHHSSQVKCPGTYLGFIEKIGYLKELGINAIEFLPLHEHFVSDLLLKKGLTNYWGYNTVGFFAPESSYASQKHPGSQVIEFKRLVKELHKAGIEIILDVVYNHTGEGNELGPTMSFKGIDNPTYYSLVKNPLDPENEPYRYYLNDTGCGNTFNVENPIVMQLVIDSLRYWVEIMHVDGFRFDLASILARVEGKFSQDSLFFEKIAKDPILSKVKMIAEPWDLTTYQIGNFPSNWSEWNGQYRDTIRRFLREDECQAAHAAKRMTGSADIYEKNGRKPYNSINFITCHDGFTLKDLFSYNNKHNEANQENNTDGMDENFSWNCGVEGETDDEIIINTRKKMIKNAMSSLLLSSGTPMMLYGDEVMRTQKGNNNAYCQDNEITWFDWDCLIKNSEIYNFCKKMIALRKTYPFFRRRMFFSDGSGEEGVPPEIMWFGRHLDPPNWNSRSLKTIFYQLTNNSSHNFLFLLFNMRHIGTFVHLPDHPGLKWHRLVDTSRTNGEDFRVKEKILRNQSLYRTSARCFNLLIAK